MDESLFEGAAVARRDQAKAEVLDVAGTLVELRAKLCAGGFTPRQAFELSRIWAVEQLSPLLPTVPGELGD